MDWFSWLSKTGLEPSLVYEYGLAFAHNELEEEDVPYLNHEFLQSMGISIAKHRLEILKLARKEGRGGGRRPMSMLIVAIKMTQKRLSKCIRSWLRREDRALVVMPSAGHSSRWKALMAKRNDNLMVGKGERLLLTNESDPTGASTPILESCSSPLAFDLRRKEKLGGDGDDDDDRDGGYWTPVLAKIRWDAMFQDLKPT
ncbi:hypothetical protein Nepgr_017749 [Nepenthes gracilis]|uniref:SAM domain-containing protein n=1 Tax=Nepenthes gracilis TaxID=150966 RepID=A0AAD3SQZ9_NEPGR|nr:hypothetical protein Nepgr_017749 [Nepenthes gracilis]